MKPHLMFAASSAIALVAVASGSSPAGASGAAPVGALPTRPAAVRPATGPRDPALLIDGGRIVPAEIPEGARLTGPAAGRGAPDAAAMLSPVTGQPAAVARKYTLTVHVTNLAGQPDSHDSVVLANVDNASVTAGFIGRPVRSGVARFTVPAGHYIVAGFFLATSGRQLTGQHIVVLPQVTVSGDRGIGLAERSAGSEVRMITPRPASLLWATLDIYRETASHQLLDIGASSIGQGPIWVNAAGRPVSVGTLRTVTAAGLISPPGSRAQYEYNLLYESADGLIPAQRRVVRPAQLATVDTRYYQAVPSAGQLYMRGLLPFQAGIIFGGFFPVNLPSRVTEYVSGNRSVVWFNEYAQTRPNWKGGQLDANRGYLAGQRVTQSWGAYPLHPAPNASVLGSADPWARQVPVSVVPSAARAGNTLLLDIDPFGDNQLGHTGGGYSAGHYRIDQNGTKIASGNAVQHGESWAFLKHVKLSPGPSLIRFTLAATRTGTLGGGRSDTLSTATRTVWTWRSTPEPGVRLPPGWWCGTDWVSPAGRGSRACAAEPMMTLRYAVQNLALDGATPPGLQVLRIFARHLQLARASRVTRATVQVSLDGGKTWRPARVVGRDGTYTALFTAPPGARVTLRTSATDAAGGSITETITNAYRAGH